MEHQPSAPRRSARGQAAVIIAVASIPVLLMVGMTVDAGNALMQRRIAQAAADAATIAGTRATAQSGSTNTTVTNEVNAFISGNTGPFGTTSLASIGWVDSAGAVVGSMGSSLGTKPVSAAGVKLTAQRTFSTYFLQLLGWNQSVAQGSAAATYTATVSGGGAVGAIYALATTGNAISMTGGTDITASAVIANANIQMTGNNTITAPTYIGHASTSQTPDNNNCIELADSACSGTTDPGEYLNQTDVVDPLGTTSPGTNLAVPSAPSAATTDTSSGRSCTGSGSKTLTPGSYSGQISTTGSCTLYLTAGTYYLNAGMSVTGSGSIQALNGTDETFIYVNTGNISITGSGTIALNPPSSGTYKGLLFFVRRNLANTISVTGKPTLYGTIYAPAATISYTGNGSGVYQGQLIAARITTTGNSTVTPATTGAYAVASTATVGGGGGTTTVTVSLVQ